MRNLFLSMLLLATIISNAQNVSIPDTNFKNALIAQGVDTNVDLEISYPECKIITYLNVVSMNISDLTGIEAFVNLVDLNCSSNKLTSLDVSNNISLVNLWCYENQLTGLNVSSDTALAFLACFTNQLTSLDVTNNAALEDFYCYQNQLTSLDISNNTALKNLYCYENQIDSLGVSNNIYLEWLLCNQNQLTSLDISNNTVLEVLACYQNQLTNLDVSNNPALSSLGCNENELTSLDVSNNPALNWLECNNNQLTGLDLSNNPALTGLICSENHLTSLNVSGNTVLEYLYVADMPILQEVCVWEIPFPPAGVTIDSTGSNNVYFTIDCTVGISDACNESNRINIYPNPSRDIINVQTENINNEIIEIYNVSGRLVYSREVNKNPTTIDMSGYPKGLYFVKVIQDGAVKVGKVIFN